jgi:transcriptional regulator with XRE-family HTH domain
MTPRRKSKSVSEVLAATIKKQREREGWTQEQLAEQMRDYGYSNWARTTVTEVEGKGRRRQVTVPELLGLTQVFGVGVDELLWDPENHPLEVSETHVLVEPQDLLAMLVSPDALADAAVRLAGPVLEKQLSRLYQNHAERVLAVTEELRSTAGYIEHQLVADLHNTKEEA